MFRLISLAKHRRNTRFYNNGFHVSGFHVSSSHCFVICNRELHKRCMIIVSWDEYRIFVITKIVSLLFTWIFSLSFCIGKNYLVLWVHYPNLSCCRSLWMICTLSETATLRLTVWRTPRRKRAMLRRRLKRHWSTCRRKRVSGPRFLFLQNKYKTIHPISHRSVETQSRVPAAEGPMFKCRSGLQCWSREGPIPCRETRAQPGRRLEHIRGTVLEKRRPHWC